MRKSEKIIFMRLYCRVSTFVIIFLLPFYSKIERRIALQSKLVGFGPRLFGAPYIKSQDLEILWMAR